MGKWEQAGKSDEWMTPKYIFDALGCEFDLDVAAPEGGAPNVPAFGYFAKVHGALNVAWSGFVWMNPPYGGRNSLMPWVEKFINHGNGLALLPDRTSAPWFAPIGLHSDAVLFVNRKIKFERADGTLGMSPGNGSVIAACGRKGELALMRAGPSLGCVMKPYGSMFNKKVKA